VLFTAAASTTAPKTERSNAPHEILRNMPYIVREEACLALAIQLKKTQHLYTTNKHSKWLFTSERTFAWTSGVRIVAIAHGSRCYDRGLAFVKMVVVVLGIMSEPLILVWSLKSNLGLESILAPQSQARLLANEVTSTTRHDAVVSFSSPLLPSVKLFRDERTCSFSVDRRDFRSTLLPLSRNCHSRHKG
jgi:hypothetical protein